MAFGPITGARKRPRITVVDYDPGWPEAFADLKADVERKLAGHIHEIHHVGSTSVPGLCAKPKLDVDVVLRDVTVLGDAISRLKADGYAYHGAPYLNGMWTFTVGRGAHGERLYLCVPGTPTHIDRMLFRDYLRDHPEAARAYCSLKRKLALEATDWADYTRGKASFVADIVRRARLVSAPS